MCVDIVNPEISSHVDMFQNVGEVRVESRQHPYYHILPETAQILFKFLLKCLPSSAMVGTRGSSELSSRVEMMGGGELGSD
jgi:hypothetical protein